ncbi:class D beta-lactamase [Hahella sp. CCB-MM4]|uniref:class D beta-lactamase n=1 Tax=Hahella sp. (strain CCB-MM4) TaxID=1926491 RepID=UPI000B9C6791|nr:class D beta-lactamase [Hahella sp. CCB-MM4]
MKLFFSLLIVLFSLKSFAIDWQQSPEIEKLFKNAGVEGTFVLYDVSEQRYIGHKQSRAETRFIPASTFKIANTLIGLTVGAIENVDEVLPYGGKPQPLDIWEKDMSLREAIPISNVPIYQELARRIGLERMSSKVKRLKYGNADIGQVVDRFWLDGPLKISAVEQTGFLSELAQNQLSFPLDAQNHTREIVKLEQGYGWTLYGKTGWGNDIGWWVGWVEKGDHIYAFALNINMYSASEAKKRIVLGKASLREVGVLD